MSICFNKKTWVWQETNTPEDLVPVEDWIIDPVYSNEAACLEVGPNGWFYEADGHTIRPMTPSEFDSNAALIAELIIQRREEVNNLRSQKISGGFTDSNGIRWNTSPTDVSNLNAVCTLVTAGAITNPVTWRDTNNTNHTLAPAQLIQLAAEMAVFGQTIYGVSWYHKANLEALTSLSVIAGYDITAGW